MRLVIEPAGMMRPLDGVFRQRWSPATAGFWPAVGGLRLSIGHEPPSWLARMAVLSLAQLAE